MGHYKMIIAAASIGALALGACGTPDNTGTGSSAQQTSDDGGAATSDAAGDGGAQAAQCIAARRFSICSDGQVVAIAVGFNTAGMNEAQTFRSLTQNTTLQAYADQLIAARTQAAAATQALLQAAGITPVDNSIAADVVANAQLEVQLLQSKAAAVQANQGTTTQLSDLDSSFLAHQILEHTTALAMLDLILIPSTKNPALQQALTQARAVEEADLAQAIQLQQTLQGACGTQSSSGADAGSSADAGSGAAGQ